MNRLETKPRALTFGPKVPKATLRKDGRYEAKGICRTTGNRRSYYSRVSAEDAEQQAFRSYGFVDESTLAGFYKNVFWPTVSGKSINWQEQVQWAMEKYILPRFGHQRLDELTRRDLQPFFTGLQDRLRSSSRGRMRNVLSCLLNLAVEDDLIAKNPAQGIKLPKEQPTQKRALTADELRLLVETAPDSIRPYMALCGLCGLRAGEALGVTKGSIRNGVLHVERQIIQPKGGCVLTETLKTQQSRRQIPLPPQVLEILQTHLHRSIYVCADAKGGFLTPNNAARALADLCLKCELVKVGMDGQPVLDQCGHPRPLITPHELRHTFISLMENELEAPSSVVSTLAGHKRQGITAGYSHATNTQRAIWMTKYADMVFGRPFELQLIQTA